MAYIKAFIKSLILIFLALTLAACGGSGGSKPTPNPDPKPPTTKNTFSLSMSPAGVIRIAGTIKPNTEITINFPDGVSRKVSTDANGQFSASSNHSQPAGGTTLTYDEGASIVMLVPTKSPSPNRISAKPDGTLTITGKGIANSTIVATFADAKQSTVKTDAKGNFSVNSAAGQMLGDIYLVNIDQNIGSHPVRVNSALVEAALYKATDTLAKLPFKPSLGINTEAPQGGADTAGMPMPFVDIFRTARPFAELSPKGTEYDTHGWPVKFATDANFARTKLLQGTLAGALPNGQYTVIYEGEGTLEFGSSGALSELKKVAGENQYTFKLTLRDFDKNNEVAAADTNAFNLNIRNSNPANPIKNIRIAMPGGTCEGNPFSRVNAQSDCPSGRNYQSFAEQLAANRNAIIFNPDYLRFLRNFKLVRMMNLMESSLKKLCYNVTECPAEVGTWAHRAKLDDAVWGGNDGRTPAKDHKGVPIEVMVALANTLQRDIWVNMPHVATDDYITNYANYVYANLDPNLQVHVEYSNEVWNPGFAAHSYTTGRGTLDNLNNVPEEFVGSNRDADYFARLRFYSKRSVEIFKRWKTAFGGASDTRVVRVLGSFIGDRILTEQMLKAIDTQQVDAVAIAPYFFGCPHQSICPDAPKTLATATSVDDIFSIIDQTSKVDVKSLAGTITAVKNQLTVTHANNVQLVAYEGGQHLVTGVLAANTTEDDKNRLRKLFNQANRDPRMKQRYIDFLNQWKDLSNQGTALFSLYTLPQSFYRFGNFGIKEHLNMPRAQSPKFDGAMQFQETVKDCWWANCQP